MWVLAATSTLRTILVLLIVWLLLRAFMNSRMQGMPKEGAPFRARPKGHVHIERTEAPRGARTTGPVEDADYEEIK
jgi:hypothetical protein